MKNSFKKGEREVDAWNKKQKYKREMKQHAIAFAEYMEKEAEKNDFIEQVTHTLEEQYEMFIQEKFPV